MSEAEDRKARARELVRAMEVVFSIECVPCGYGTNALAVTEWAAATEFEAAGWRIVDNEAHCPQCVDPSR